MPSTILSRSFVPFYQSSSLRRWELIVGATIRRAVNSSMRVREHLQSIIELIKEDKCGESENDERKKDLQEGEIFSKLKK